MQLGGEEPLLEVESSRIRINTHSHGLCCSSSEEHHLTVAGSERLKADSLEILSTLGSEMQRTLGSILRSKPMPVILALCREK